MGHCAFWRKSDKAATLQFLFEVRVRSPASAGIENLRVAGRPLCCGRVGGEGDELEPAVPDAAHDRGQGGEGGGAVAAAVVEDHDRAGPHSGEDAFRDLFRGAAGAPVGRVNRPEHDPLAECRRGTDKCWGAAAAGRPEQSRRRPQSGENLSAEHDLITEKLRRELRERRHFRMVVAVVSDRHPQVARLRKRLDELAG